jgi:hypothetical protein
MKFTPNRNVASLVLSGTKRGKQVFFADGIQEETAHIDNFIFDVRTLVQWERTNLTFFAFEQGNGFVVFSAYRTINDWLNRLGYYAVSVVIPEKYQVSSAQDLVAVLKTMLDIYKQQYMHEQSFRIKEEAKETIEPFKELLYSLRLEPTQKKQRFQKEAKGQYIYAQEEEIVQFFQAFQAIEQDQICFLPQIQRNNGSLRCSDNVKHLPIPAKPKEEITTLPENKNLKIKTIQVLDAENGNVIQTFTFSVEKPRFRQFSWSTPVEIDISDDFEATIEADGYKTEKVGKTQMERWNTEGLVTIRLTKKMANSEVNGLSTPTEKPEPTLDKTSEPHFVEKYKMQLMIGGFVVVMLVLLAIFLPAMLETKEPEEVKNDGKKEVKEGQKKTPDNLNAEELKKQIDAHLQTLNFRGNAVKNNQELLEKAKQAKLTLDIEKLEKFAPICEKLAKVQTKIWEDKVMSGEDITALQTLLQEVENDLKPPIDNPKDRELVSNYKLLLQYFQAGSSSVSYLYAYANNKDKTAGGGIKDKKNKDAYLRLINTMLNPPQQIPTPKKIQ